MRKLVLIITLALPLVGCASITDYITPASIPVDVLEFAGVTNKPASAFLGLYTNKKDLLSMQQRVKNVHRLNVLDFQQTADREGLHYELASNSATDALKDATLLQAEVVDPAVNTGIAAISALLGTGLGWRFLKRPKDISPEEKEREVLAAGLTDPEEFKKKIVS